MSWPRRYATLLKVTLGSVFLSCGSITCFYHFFISLFVFHIPSLKTFFCADHLPAASRNFLTLVQTHNFRLLF